MINYLEKRKKTLPYRILSAFIAFSFTFTLVLPPSYAQSVFTLPAPGTMVTPAAAFTPALINGITIHPENPLQFDFIVNTGNSKLAGQELTKEANKLIKYFLAALTVPEKELWVNLSPYEKDRIIPQGFGDTEMGRDLLAQDYILKQLTASLMYPEKELGKKFWDKVYKQAREKYGTTEIPMDTFNKVWIVPQDAVIYEQGNSAFVVQSHLKVMLEEDYMAVSHQSSDVSHQKNDGLTTDDRRLTTQVIREIIIPALEKEVNEGQTFANLRQIYNSTILATWYKMTLKESLLGQVYADRNKTKGIDTEDKQVNEKIYNQYLEAFKKGVYNYIKEDTDPVTNEVIPRKYFSGGANLTLTEATNVNAKSALSRLRRGANGALAMVALGGSIAGGISASNAEAMIASGLNGQNGSSHVRVLTDLQEFSPKVDQKYLAELSAKISDGAVLNPPAPAASEEIKAYIEQQIKALASSPLSTAERDLLGAYFHRLQGIGLGKSVILRMTDLSFFNEISAAVRGNTEFFNRILQVLVEIAEQIREGEAPFTPQLFDVVPLLAKSVSKDSLDAFAQLTDIAEIKSETLREITPLLPLVFSKAPYYMGAIARQLAELTRASSLWTNSAIDRQFYQWIIENQPTSGAIADDLRMVTELVRLRSLTAEDVNALKESIFKETSASSPVTADNGGSSSLWREVKNGLFFWRKWRSEKEREQTERLFRKLLREAYIKNFDRMIEQADQRGMRSQDGVPVWDDGVPGGFRVYFAPNSKSIVILAEQVRGENFRIIQDSELAFEEMHGDVGRPIGSGGITVLFIGYDRAKNSFYVVADSAFYSHQQMHSKVGTFYGMSETDFRTKRANGEISSDLEEIVNLFPLRDRVLQELASSPVAAQERLDALLSGGLAHFFVNYVNQKLRGDRLQEAKAMALQLLQEQPEIRLTTAPEVVAFAEKVIGRVLAKDRFNGFLSTDEGKRFRAEMELALGKGRLEIADQAAARILADYPETSLALPAEIAEFMNTVTTAALVASSPVISPEQAADMLLQAEKRYSIQRLRTRNGIVDAVVVWKKPSLEDHQVFPIKEDGSLDLLGFAPYEAVRAMAERLDLDVEVGTGPNEAYLTAIGVRGKPSRILGRREPLAIIQARVKEFLSALAEPLLITEHPALKVNTRQQVTLGMDRSGNGWSYVPLVIDDTTIETFSEMVERSGLPVNAASYRLGKKQANLVMLYKPDEEFGFAAIDLGDGNFIQFNRSKIDYSGYIELYQAHMAKTSGQTAQPLVLVQIAQVITDANEYREFAGSFIIRTVEKAAGVENWDYDQWDRYISRGVKGDSRDQIVQMISALLAGSENQVMAGKITSAALNIANRLAQSQQERPTEAAQIEPQLQAAIKIRDAAIHRNSTLSPRRGASSPIKVTSYSYTDKQGNRVTMTHLPDRKGITPMASVGITEVEFITPDNQRTTRGVGGNPIPKAMSEVMGFSQETSKNKVTNQWLLDVLSGAEREVAIPANLEGAETGKREYVIAGNYKMSDKTLTQAQVKELVRQTVKNIYQKLPKGTNPQDLDIVIPIGVSYVHLAAAQSAIKELENEGVPSGIIQLAVQDISAYEPGARTGEVAVEQLADFNVKYVILGHSERRRDPHINETSQFVNAKAKRVLAQGLTPIIALGENLGERRNGRTFEIIASQLLESIAGFSEDEIKRTVIAYEPVWAIGTGQTATPQQANEIHRLLRALIFDRYGWDAARGIRIIYGGSVKAGNIGGLIREYNIDGALVGGDALDAEAFSDIAIESLKHFRSASSPVKIDGRTAAESLRSAGFNDDLVSVVSPTLGLALEVRRQFQDRRNLNKDESIIQNVVLVLQGNENIREIRVAGEPAARFNRGTGEYSVVIAQDNSAVESKSGLAVGTMLGIYKKADMIGSVFFLNGPITTMAITDGKDIAHYAFDGEQFTGRNDVAINLTAPTEKDSPAALGGLYTEWPQLFQNYYLENGRGVPGSAKAALKTRYSGVRGEDGLVHGATGANLYEILVNNGFMTEIVSLEQAKILSLFAEGAGGSAFIMTGDGAISPRDLPGELPAVQVYLGNKDAVGKLRAYLEARKAEYVSKELRPRFLPAPKKIVVVNPFHAVQLEDFLSSKVPAMAERPDLIGAIAAVAKAAQEVGGMYVAGARPTGQIDSGGAKQLAIDEQTDQLFMNALRPWMKEYYSEDLGHVVDFNGDGVNLRVMIDALDGSSRVKGNGGSGTIINFRKFLPNVPIEDQTGKEIVASMIIVHGITPKVIIAIEGMGVYEFVLDEGTFYGSRQIDLDQPKIEGKGLRVALGGERKAWPKGFPELVDQWTEQGAIPGYSGALVTDIFGAINHMLDGGRAIFSYPANKLRIKSELQAIAYLFKVAGGANLTYSHKDGEKAQGLTDLLDVKLTPEPDPAEQQKGPSAFGDEETVWQMESVLAASSPVLTREQARKQVEDFLRGPGGDIFKSNVGSDRLEKAIAVAAELLRELYGKPLSYRIFHTGLTKRDITIFPEVRLIDLKDEIGREELSAFIQIVFSRTLGVTQRPNIDPAMLSEEEVLAKTPDQIKIGNTNVGIVQGDITQVSSDAVVPGVNTSMAVGMGVTGAIIGAVGRNNAPKIFPPPRVAIGRNSFKVGDVYVASLEGISTRAGWKYVISAMIHTGEPWGEPTEDSVRISTKKALEEGDRRNLASITFPAFGTGVLGMDFATSARSMYAGIQEFLKENPETKVRDIKVVLFDFEAATPFRQELAQFSSSPILGSSDAGMSGKDWQAIEDEFSVLIQAATSQNELKRVYRRLAQETHPDKNRGDERNAEKVFKKLAQKTENRLEREFEVKASIDRDDAKDFGFGWVSGWAAAAAFYAEDNENVMGEAVKALQKRAKRITKEGERRIAPVIQVIANLASILSVRDLEDLLNIASKERFASALIAKMPSGTLSKGDVSDETFWEARPMLEKLFSAKTLRGGEIVHIRRGNELIRTVILKSITADNPKLKVIMVTAPFGLLIMDLPQNILDIEASEIVSPAFDLEREPTQKGWDINVGDQLEFNVDFEGSLVKGKVRATVIAAYGGAYTMIAQRQVHNNMDNYGGYGLVKGKWGATDDLKAGKITKVVPLLESSGRKKRTASSPVTESRQTSDVSLQTSLMTDDGRLTTNPGGIDLNPELLDLQIKRDGNGVPLPLPMQPIKDMHIEGFLPVIINVTPIPNLPMSLGLVDTDSDTEVTKPDLKARELEEVSLLN